MEKEDIAYVKKQLHIIDKKENIEELSRYASSLYASKLKQAVKSTLIKAVEVKHSTLIAPLPMATHGDIEDILD